jgi:hypothetical protein
MDDGLVAYLLDRLHEAEKAILETEHRIGGVPLNDDAQRSLTRAQKAVSSALKRLDPNSDVEDE